MRVVRVCFVLFSLLITSVALVPSVSEAAPSPITGTVIRDQDQDGTRDSRDVGVADVTVSVTDDTGSLVGTTTTATDGTYSVAGTDDGESYRVEFSWTESYLRSSAVGPDNGSSVQFASGGDIVDFAVANPADFCSATPATVEFATTCFVNGDPNGAAALNGALATIVTTVQASGVAGADAPAADTVATAADTGSTYGLAYEPLSDRLFTSAYMKRHVGLGTGGIDAFYALDLAGGTTSLWYDAIDAGTVDSNAARGLPDDVGDPQTSLDAAAFAQIGKVGWGDIDLSEDRNTLFASNLFDRSVYAIDIAAADGGSTTAHTSLGRPTLTCTNGVDRPFALEVRDGLLYVGVTCTAESGGTRADLSAHVFSYDLDAGTWSATPVLDVPLDYDDGCLLRTRGCENHPWLDTYSDTDFFFTTNMANPFEFPLRPQPMLSDIEFDSDGSMIVGFRDRQSDQFGHRNQTPDGSGNLVTTAANGDVLRAAAPASPGATFTLESAGVAGTRVSSGSGTARTGPGGPLSSQGPGGGEFYWTDYVTNSGEFFHSETFMGALANIPGSDTTAATQVDPIDERLDAGGIVWLEHDTGADRDAIELYRDASTPQPPTLGKANGLGDIEALCSAAPVEIGNRVWFDRNADGIQDAGEPGIPGVTVTLSDGQTTVTSADGSWMFPVVPNTDYTVIFDPSTADVSSIPEVNSAGGLSGTTPDQGAVSEVDSDIDVTTLSTMIRSMGPGENDHSIDAGFIAAPLEIGNLVWLDSDDDGQAETGEPGLPGVRVELWQDTNLDGTKETKIDEQLTDADGHYLFTGLGVGSYGVVVPDQSGPGEALEKLRSSTPTEADPDADTDNDDNGIDPPILPSDLMSGLIQLDGTEALGETSRSDSTDVDPASPGTPDASSNLTLDFGFVPTASIGDTVWFDNDEDGQQDPGESGVPDVTVNLCDSSGTVIATTVTAADGTFEFDFLPPGDYQICFDLTTLPTDYVPTSQDSGNDDGLDSDADPTTGITPVTRLDPLEDDDTWDLGIVSTIPRYELGNLVWLDTNNDGSATSGEPGLVGVIVELFADDGSGGKGARLASTTTDAAGHYLFTNLAAGKYLVNIPDQSASGLPLSGLSSSDPTATDPDSDADNDDNGLNPATPSIGVMSAVVTLADQSEPLAERRRSDDSALDAATFADDQSNLTVDFGFYPLASLGDKVWFDDDRDGIQDPGEDPVPDVTVQLCDADGNPIATTITDDDGMYIFDDLPAGEYTVCFDLTTLPDGFGGTSPDKGADDGLDSDADPTTGRTPVTDLDPGEHDPTLDLGIALVDIPTEIPVTGSGLPGLLLGSGMITAGAGFALLSLRRVRLA